MKKRANGEFHFMLRNSGGCGLCGLNTLLMKFKRRGVIFRLPPDGRVSPKRVLFELRSANLFARSMMARNPKPWSFLWYPKPRDHYVVAGEVIKKGKDGWVLIYDSEKKEPYWMRLSALKKKWYYPGRSRGWLIEVKEPL